MTANSSVRVVPEPVLIALSSIRDDGGTQIRVQPTDASLVQDLVTAYVVGPPPPPLVVFKDGANVWLADGFHRLAAAKATKTLISVHCEVHIGDLGAAIDYACGANAAHGLRRSNADKRNAVVKAVENDARRVAEGHEPRSNPEIARICGVHHSLVYDIRPPKSSESEERTDEPSEPRGTEEPRVTRDRDDADPREVEYDEPDVETEHTFTGGSRDPAAVNWRPVDGDSWSTPDEYIDEARAVLGTIDLDPATNAAAQGRIGATTHYTEADDGLSKAWSGKVWLNPPYSQPKCTQFAEKLVAEFDAGNVTEAILLVNNATDTKWMQPLLRRFVCCFPEGRIKFVNERNEPAMSPRDAQVFVYLGKDPSTFVRVFGAVGAVMGPL